jgi:hypothetical protein
MSANPADEALERLNYFNGQRLAAADFRAEQGHHTGMRRVLNSALYSPGVVTGLEVEKDTTNKHRVIVRKGLAFDHLGREIFLAADQFVQAMGAPSTTKGIVLGNLLVVSYREQRKSPVSDGCAVTVTCTPCSGDLAWGSPSRIVAEAVFEVLDSWPAADSGKIVLAQLELSKTCQVVRVLPGVRQYAVPVKPQTVIPVSLEGEKDIDATNPKVLYFHVIGGYPETVTLYLRARKFSSLYYTELGQHKHHIDFVSGKGGHVDAHRHGLDFSSLKLKENGDHQHEIWAASDDDQSGSFDLGGDDPNWPSLPLTGTGGAVGGAANMEVKVAGKHSHDLDLGDVPAKTAADGEVPDHTHPVTGDTKNTGNVPAARTNNPLTYVKDMQVWLDGQEVTALVCQQLNAKPGEAGKWNDLGDGTAAHALAKLDGTGEIDLLKLGVEIGLGSHKLEFKVLAPGGGAIQYNLYVA